jgi:hypothetical protein
MFLVDDYFAPFEYKYPHQRVRDKWIKKGKTISKFPMPWNKPNTKMIVANPEWRMSPRIM